MENEVLKRIHAKLDVILFFTKHKPTAMHFYRLRKRLIEGKKLTKKMNENLEWIKRDAEKEIKDYNQMLMERANRG
jgi:hypothetical protein